MRNDVQAPVDARRDQRRQTVRTALILASIAAAFFVGIMIKTVLFGV